MQDSKVEKETRPGSRTGVHFDVATEIDRPNTTPPLVSVPNLTNWNQPWINHAQYCVQANATQPQAETTNPVSLMAQQIAFLKPNSCFTVPANLVLPNLLIWTFPKTGCAVPNVAILRSAPQSPSREPNTNSHKWFPWEVVVLFTTWIHPQDRKHCRKCYANERFLNTSDERCRTRIRTCCVFCNALNGTYCFHGTRFSRNTGILKKKPSTRVETDVIQQKFFTMARVVRPVKEWQWLSSTNGRC